MKVFEGLTTIVAAPSVNGAAGSAAVMRHGPKDLQLIFKQAHEVDQITEDELGKRPVVGIVDLAVYTEDRGKNTIAFINKVYELGGRVLFIADDHDRNAWGDVFENTTQKDVTFTIDPRTRGDEYPNSCAILGKAISEIADQHTKDLLAAGNLDFEGKYGQIFHDGVTSGDLEKLSKLARHYAVNTEPME